CQSVQIGSKDIHDENSIFFEMFADKLQAFQLLRNMEQVLKRAESDVDQRKFLIVFKIIHAGKTEVDVAEGGGLDFPFADCKHLPVAIQSVAFDSELRNRQQQPAGAASKL